MSQPDNMLAPDGYRYGVMFHDESVMAVWNGATQRQRAEAYGARVVFDQVARAGRHDNIRMVRRRPDTDWEEYQSDG